MFRAKPSRTANKELPCVNLRGSVSVCCSDTALELQSLPSGFESRLCAIKLKSALVYLLFLIFKLLLDFSFVTIIVPQYGYMGFSLVDSPFKVFAGLIMFFLLLLFIPIGFNTPSSILTLGLFLMTYPAALTMFSYGGASWGFLLINTMFWLLVTWLLRLIPTVALPRINKKTARLLFLIVVFAICAYCIFFVVKTFGFSISFNFMDVYDQREAYKQANIPFSAYAFTWSSNVILPMGLLYLLRQKKYILSLLPLVSILLLFSATGMKSMLFTVPIVLIFAVFMRSKQVTLWVASLLVAAAAGCLILYFYFDQILPVSLFTRRVFLVPAQISNYYYQFFEQEGHIQLAHSIFSGFVPYRFELEPAKFISGIFVGSDSNFNTGIIGDGYANFGLIGVLCWSIFIAFIFKMIDSVAVGKNKIVAMAGYIMFLSSISNAALITNLGTHGMLIGIAMLYLLPVENAENAEAISSIRVT